MSNNTFKIGEIVTLKSHPLAFQENGKIDLHVTQIPPFMCVKEVHIEKKKIIFSKDIENLKIADHIKYLCTYFNQHRMVFEERFIYHDILTSLKDITFHNEKENTEEGYIKLVDETNSYSIASYNFGKRVFFKTFKLEKRKKFKTNSAIKVAMAHTSPAFVLNGYKLNDQRSLFNEKTGELQRECSKELYKILWYNSYQEKFSEDYLPMEFFTDDERIYLSHPEVVFDKTLQN